MEYDVLIAGVGGQGTVLASRLLAAAAMHKGVFVRTAETIGMAQRGGCVVSHVRMGSEEKSSLIPMGMADLLIGFEPAEAARNLPRLKPEGKCIANTHVRKPVTASLSGACYDVDAVRCALEKNGCVLVDAQGIAARAGMEKAVNVALLGAAVGHGMLPFTIEDLQETIVRIVPEQYQEMNLRALALGYQE